MFNSEISKTTSAGLILIMSSFLSGCSYSNTPSSKDLEKQIINYFALSGVNVNVNKLQIYGCEPDSLPNVINCKVDSDIIFRSKKNGEIIDGAIIHGRVASFWLNSKTGLYEESSSTLRKVGQAVDSGS